MDEVDDRVVDAMIELGGQEPSVALEAKLRHIQNWAKSLEVKIDNVTHTFDVVAEVTYSSENLDQELEMHAGKVAFWSSLCAKLNRVVSCMKDANSALKAQVASEVRNGKIRVAGGKVTESSIKETVTLDPRVRLAEIQLHAAQEKLEQARGVLEALRQRKEMMYIDGLLQNTERRQIGNVIKE